MNTKPMIGGKEEFRRLVSRMKVKVMGQVNSN
jgi:hypothetical protein